MSKPLLMLMLFAGMLTTPASQADEIKPQTQRTSRKPAITPAATTNRKLEPAATAKSAASDNKNTQEQSKNQSPAAREETLMLQDDARNVLDDLRVKPDIADKLVKEVADPDKKESAIDRVRDIANAAGELDVVGVDAKARDRVVDAISRSENPKEAANEAVGEAATESVFGKEVAKLVPGGKKGKFRELFMSLLEIQGSLEHLGAEPDAPEVVEAIKEGAREGVTTRQEARAVMEKAAHKVLDRQGFTPGKPGETLNARLTAMAEEQKILQAELDAKKAAKAKADLLARQREKVGAGNLGNSAITQGAAGSTATGRSVSSKVTVAVGGGKSNTSGAGTAQHGTGTDATKTVGSGGQNRADMASTRLSADKGGVSNAGQPATGNQPTTNPGGGNTPPAATTPPAGDSAPANIDTNNAPQSPILSDADVNTPATSQPATTTAPNNPQADRGNPNSQVTSGGSEVLVGMNGPHVSVGTENYQMGDNSRTSTTYFADGTFEQTTVTVTRDSSGHITSSTETKSTGTWAPDSRGNKEQTSTTSSNSTTTASNHQGSTSTSNQSDSDDDDDDDDDKNQSEDPPPAEQASTEQTEETSTSEESKAASTTPNPMDIGGGDPSQLSTSTGGRLGNQEARRQQRGLELARAGGGAAGPNPEGKGGSYTLLTPEETANAERALNMRAGAGVTNPNPLGKDSVTATERDLKELYLRGNGGAKGPTDKTTPTKPQDPRSPVGGNTPGLAPTGGTRINASKTTSATTQRKLNGNSRIAVDGLKSNLRN